jgi:hypothetical protein
VVAQESVTTFLHIRSDVGVWGSLFGERLISLTVGMEEGVWKGSVSRFIPRLKQFDGEIRNVKGLRLMSQLPAFQSGLKFTGSHRLAQIVVHSHRNLAFAVSADVHRRPRRTGILQTLFLLAEGLRCLIAVHLRASAVHENDIVRNPPHRF